MVEIERAAGSDLSGVRALLERAALPVEGLTGDILVLVARDRSGSIIGSAAIEEFAGGALLRSVTVDEERRGRGVGMQLTRAALDLAASRGHADVFLLTTTAGAFFPKFGFAPIERGEVPADVRGSVEFVSACPSNALVMHARCDGRVRPV